MRRAISSFSLAWSFVLLFLLAQAGAVAHEFRHLGGDADEAVEVCALCLATAALDFAASLPPAPDWGVPPILFVVFAPRCVSCVSSSCRAYQGRAPPALARLR